MSKVAYDLTLARYAGKHDLYFLIEYRTVISDARVSEIQKCKDLPIPLKLNCLCRSPAVGEYRRVLFLICKKIGMC